MMKKLYRVKIDTERASIVFEFDVPITVARLARVVSNNFAPDTKLENISYDEYNKVVTE